MCGLTRWGRVAAVVAALMLFWAVVPTGAQGEKPKIALYIANDKLNADQKSVLTAKLLKPFTASGMYSVVDRSDIFTKKAALERIKQRDGSVNDKEIYKIGNEAGAKYVCMVDLRKAFGPWNISARLVDVETAEIYLAQGETDIAGELDKADISGAAKGIFEQIHGKSGGSVAQTQQYQTPAQTTVSTSTPQSISYGGKTYNTVVIGGKTWMAENLNYQTASGYWCYKNDNSNCDKYGRLYDWNTARTVCPAGFHLPSRQEWNDLVNAVGGGKKLKARSGWNNIGNGTDDFGFSALPSGGRYAGGGFYDAGSNGYWWTATEYGDNYAYYRHMSDRNGNVNEDNNGKDFGYSVRCVADN